MVSKNSMEQSKQYLKHALQHLLMDESLNDVRYHIRMALQKIEHIENKRTTNIETSKNLKINTIESLKIGVNASRHYDINKGIWAIDAMIDDEKKKIENIGRRRSQRNANQQTFLG